MEDHSYRAMVIPTSCVIGAAPLYSHLSKQEVDELRELCRRDGLEVIEEKEKHL